MLGLFLSSGCPPLPAVGLLQAAFCWPATFFHTSARRVRRAVSSSLHPSIPILLLCLPPTPSGGAGGSLPWQLVKKPKLALLAVHRWQRHFAFLLIRKQNNTIKRGPIRRRVDKHVPQIAREGFIVASLLAWNNQGFPVCGEDNTGRRYRILQQLGGYMQTAVFLTCTGWQTACWQVLQLDSARAATKTKEGNLEHCFASCWLISFIFVKQYATRLKAALKKCCTSVHVYLN